MNKREYFEKRKGEPVAILCSRYWWRGIIAEVGDNEVILADTYLIIETGKMDNVKAKTEEACGTDTMVSFDAIELCGQFPWCFEGYDKKGDK
jgi:hypothetical protein